MFSMTKVMTSLPTSLLIFLAIELMVMDPTQFRERFKAWKDGKKPYQNGLPAYAEGAEPNIDHTIDFLKQYEGFKDTAYTDGNGIPTIGYGFTDSSLVKKGTISRAEADARLKREVLNREAFLSRLTNWDRLSEGSKTALRSYYYNYPAGFKDTTKFMKAWNSGNYREAIRQVDAGWNDTKNPGLRKRRQEEQALLMADPFLIQAPPPQSITPVIQQPVSTNVKQIIPEEQMRARWAGVESISPYVTGKPMVKLQPVIKMPNLIEMVEDSQWEPNFKNGKLPRLKYRE